MRTIAGLSLLLLAACSTDPAPTTNKALPISPSQGSSVPFSLRGSLDEKPENPAPLEAIAVASLGPDEQVASAEITKALATRPRFDIKMGFTPGDGAAALCSALAEALDTAAPKGIDGRFQIDGHIDISSTETGDTGIALTWAVRDASGAAIGQVTQTTTASPSKIAGFWGDFAKSAAAPAAKGIVALIASQSRQQGNAS
jgi:hypothetical protein